MAQGLLARADFKWLGVCFWVRLKLSAGWYRLHWLPCTRVWLQKANLV